MLSVRMATLGMLISFSQYPSSLRSNRSFLFLAVAGRERITAPSDENEIESRFLFKPCGCLNRGYTRPVPAGRR